MWLMQLSKHVTCRRVRTERNAGMLGKAISVRATNTLAELAVNKVRIELLYYR